eukprot:4937669-Pleurochrysis_carterae.AAC.1
MQVGYAPTPSPETCTDTTGESRSKTGDYKKSSYGTENSEKRPSRARKAGKNMRPIERIPKSGHLGRGKRAKTCGR